jgi:hypothetical protein
MIDFKSSMLTIAKGTTLVLLSIVCIGLVWVVFSFVVSSDYRSSIVQTFKAFTGSKDPAEAVSGDVAKPGTADYADISQMQIDHLSVINWVFQCTKTERPNALSQFIKDMYPGYYFGPASGERTREGEIRYAVRIPDNSERALMQLSYALWSQRYSLRLKTQDAYLFWQVTTFITIALGMLTTILISLSSTALGQGEGRPQRAIRILAIVFPALGTASAAMIAFYGPQADWSQASRTLASLTQLAGKMSFGVWDLDCYEAPKPDPNADKEKNAENKEKAIKTTQAIKTALKEWTTQYIGIQTVPNPTSQTGTVGSSGIDASGVNPGKPGGGGTVAAPNAVVPTPSLPSAPR